VNAVKIALIDRILLLSTVVLAGYLVVIGIDQFAALPIIAYTIAFGILIVAGLLLMILGFEVLESPLVVIISTTIPLALSLGLVWQHYPSLRTPALIFTIAGWLAVIVTRTLPLPGRLPVVVLAIVHGAAGLAIFIAPLLLTIQDEMKPAFALVGIGGGLIGVGGVLLAFLRAGRPVISRETIWRILPWLLLLMTACFAAGFRLG
jgi:hypothetical protein